MNKEKRFDYVILGEEYCQGPSGIMKKLDDDTKIRIGKMYIRQMTIKKDVKDRYEPLYSMRYDDLLFKEERVVEDKTFDELVSYIKKQKLIYEKQANITDILTYNVVYNHGTVNNIEFIIKEKHDFELEGLPMKKI